MKKDRQPSEEEMRPEYRREDLGKGVRGKYLKAYSEGVSFAVVGLKTDVKTDSVRLMREIRDEISCKITGMNGEVEEQQAQEHPKTREDGSKIA